MRPSSADVRRVSIYMHNISSAQTQTGFLLLLWPFACVCPHSILYMYIFIPHFRMNTFGTGVCVSMDKNDKTVPTRPSSAQKCRQPTTHHPPPIHSPITHCQNQCVKCVCVLVSHKPFGRHRRIVKECVCISVRM